MLDSDIFLSAAEVVDNGKERGCCRALAEALGQDLRNGEYDFNTSYHHKFYEYFPYLDDLESYISHWGDYDQGEQDVRVIALCLMATIVEQGD